MCDDRPWVITAPWWRWPKLGVAGRDPRTTAPVIQKYDLSDPVTPFLKDPQHTLAYTSDDFVQQLSQVTPPGGKKPGLRGWTQTPTTTRKLFLPAHKRFYLFVCELHCDSRGLPSVTRDKVCETGFVVRRRSLSFAPEHAAEAASIVDEIGSLNAKLAQMDRGGGRLLQKRVQVTSGGVFGMSATASPPKSTGSAVPAKLAEQRTAIETQLAQARAKLAAWKVDSGAVSVVEGWIPDADAENVGAWQAVDETPRAVEEVIYPLTPLVPDPRSPQHDGAGKTIWFGVVPGGSREVEVNGYPRFDDETRYEIRCFVRRHRCNCPKTGERNDCGGELVWSAPTAAFQLAAYFDPTGTGNHPINIKMPDIPALAASAARLPVAMHFPKGSALNIQSDSDQKPKNPSTNPNAVQICFFSIPLITIVATFVLNLFLPIVVFLFGLWFLLGLKFCIPPSLSLSAGASFDVSASLSARIDAALSIDVTIADDLAAELSLALSPPTAGDILHPPAIGDLPVVAVDAHGNYKPKPGTLGETLENAFDPSALAELHANVGKDRTDEVKARDITAGVQWVPRVERWEVGA